MALRFPLHGAERGEKCLYITLSETEPELRSGAASHGWTLNENIEVFELAPPESLLAADQEHTLLYSSDLELGETTRMIFDAFERHKPARVVLDMECAPAAGQDQAAVLTGARALRSSNWMGLR